MQVCHVALSDTVLEIIFALFGNEAGKLEVAEFSDLLLRCSRRGAGDAPQVDMPQQSCLFSFFNCVMGK